MSTVIDLPEPPLVPWPIVCPPAEHAAAVIRDTARAAAAHGRRVRSAANRGLFTCITSGSRRSLAGQRIGKGRGGGLGRAPWPARSPPRGAAPGPAPP